jgi:hypothetical protein
MNTPENKDNQDQDDFLIEYVILEPDVQYAQEKHY